MKKVASMLITFAILGLMLTSSLSVIAPNETTPTTVTVTLKTELDGQAIFTSERNHTALYSAKLVIPTGAREGSCAYALYPVNKTLDSITSLYFYTAYTNATPRLFITLDKNNDNLTDSMLLGEYQSPSNGEWKCTGASTWTESTRTLTSTLLNYEEDETSLTYWKTLYGNATVAYVGLCLDYEAVESNGFDVPMYADKLVLNGAYIRIVPADGSPIDTDAEINPSPTPTPNATITPTPKPEPTLNLTCSSSVTQSSLKVDITGSLTGNNTALSGESIQIYYSLSGGNSWNELTYVNTNEDGRFSAIWLPTASGNLLIKAIFQGNSEYSQVRSMVNLAITEADEEESLFSVSSNSTLSELSFDANNKELSFSVSGEDGTTGYVDVYIPKSLISDISGLKVYLDGNETQYLITSVDDVWLLQFTYHHSTHEVSLTMNSLATQSNTNLLGDWTLIAGIVAIATISMIVIALALVTRRKQ